MSSLALCLLGVAAIAVGAGSYLFVKHFFGQEAATAFGVVCLVAVIWQLWNDVRRSGI